MMNENAMLHLHALELRETFFTLQKFLGAEQATNVIIEHMTDGINFAQEIRIFLDSPVHRKQHEDDKIAYYLTAGCGVVRIIRLLGVGQGRIYRVKEAMHELEERKLGMMQNMFRLNPSILDNLHQLMAHLNVLDSFRIADEAYPHTYLVGQVRGK